MNKSKELLSFRKYPSTMALKCFETAARLLSFTNAAQELHMTQSAVSKQVAQLEEMLNIPLFYRTSQRISLTPAGKQYYLQVINILSQIEHATTSLMSQVDNGEALKIIAHPTFCARWLIPALDGFTNEYPLISLEMHEHVGPFFPEDHDIDVAFLYGNGVWMGMESVKLFDEFSIAVCSPAYYENFVKSNTGADINALDGCALLHLNSRASAWYNFFKQQNINKEKTFIGPKFDTFQASIAAAMLGYGIALVPRFLVRREILSGALVQACAHAAKSRRSYYVSYPLTLGNSHKVMALLTWVFAYADTVSHR